MAVSFRVVARSSHARAGVLATPHGEVPTPAFMPVGTRGAVRALSAADLRASGATLVLANSYHLMLQPGVDTLRALGGLHRFMAWDGPILTDSGGYQVFSLGELARVTNDQVTFRSHLDGSAWELSPERAIEIQAAIGVDVAMALDHCPPGDAPPGAVAEATRRTTLWARRTIEARPDGQAVFGIVQGGADVDARLAHLDAIAALPFDGIALGGLGVGEPAPRMLDVIARVAPRMPGDRPRYLMGLGTPADIAAAVRAGIDLFDCVLPTRSARHGLLYTSRGEVRIGNAAHREDPSPLDPDCACETCRSYTRGYLRHLYRAGEPSWHRLATLHNLTFYLAHLLDLRERILAGEVP